jgi:hypothetical protein
MTIRDDGAGFEAKTESKQHGLGLVRRLVEQVRGNASLDSINGTVWTVSTPRNPTALQFAVLLAKKRPEGCLGFGGVRLHHFKVDLAILEAIARQTILCHFLKPDPVLAEIAGRLVLRLKFCLQAAGVVVNTICDLKKDGLLSFEVRL